MKPLRKAWYEANKEKQREYSREWYERNKNNPERQAKEKEKARRRRLKNTGFTPGMINDVLRLQAGVCAICEAELQHVKINADHCHDTGSPRGLLCTRCNLGIGAFHDRPELLRAAIDYLEDPPTKHLGAEV